ncbi:MAG: NUDIX hydrolase [Bacteroidetes bacterium]|nr:NUDIX hydrolase [Bacteroidota bacterium]
MALRRWQKLSEQVIHRNPWWTYMRDHVRHPGGTEGEYHFVRTPGSVMIIPRREDGRFVLVRQYRYLNDRESVEFPAGGLKHGQSPAGAAAAELAEEAALAAAHWQQIGVFNPFNGVTEELCHCFLAEDLQHCTAEPDDTEEFEIISCTAHEIDGMIKDGRLWDGMSLAAWSLYRAVVGEVYP